MNLNLIVNQSDITFPIVKLRINNSGVTYKDVQILLPKKERKKSGNANSST